MNAEERAAMECKRASWKVYVIGITLITLVFSIFGLISYVSQSTGLVANRLDMHRYCLSLTTAACSGLSSTSNITGNGYLLIDPEGGYIKHKFFLINGETNTMSDLSLWGPLNIDVQDLSSVDAAAYIPSDGTSFNITLDTDTNNLQGSYKLKTVDRNDIPLAKLVIQDPTAYILVLSTEEDPTGAVCARLSGECRPLFHSSDSDFP
jgi:hypothetical protein